MPKPEKTDNKQPKDKIVTILLNADTKDRCVAIAQSKDVSLGTICRWAIEEYLEKETIPNLTLTDK